MNLLTDVNGKGIEDGKYYFYSERPFSNYADGIYRLITEDGATAMKCLIVRKGESRREYYTDLDFDIAEESKLMKYHVNKDWMEISGEAEISGEFLEKQAEIYDKIINDKLNQPTK